MLDQNYERRSDQLIERLCQQVDKLETDSKESFRDITAQVSDIKGILAALQASLELRTLHLEKRIEQLEGIETKVNKLETEMHHITEAMRAQIETNRWRFAQGVGLATFFVAIVLWIADKIIAWNK